MSDNLKNKTEKALIWSFTDKFGQQVLYFASGIILANLLTPSDYGKVGLLALFIALSNILVDSGFGSALIRKKDASQEDYSTIFYFNIVLSLLFYGALFLCAPLLASFFEIPELTAIARILFLSIIFQAFGVIQQTQMFKHIRFTYLARINITALAISSAAAIYMAFSGAGVWSLVVQSVGMAMIKSALLWYYGQWRPILTFKVSSIKEFASYSSNLLGTGILNTVFNNIYPLLIGKGFSTAAVGFYTQANKFQDIPSALIGNIFRSVAFPVLSSIKEDKERLLRIFGKYIRTTAFFIFPIMGAMILMAKPLILALISEKWEESIPMLQVLCIAGMFSPIIILYYDIFNTIGRSDINFKMEIVKKIALIISITACFSLGGGIMSLIWLWVIYTILSLTATSVISNIAVGYTVKNLILDIIPYLSITIISMAVSSLLYLFLSNSWALLLTIFPTFTIIYLCTAAIFKTEVLRECYSLVMRKIGKNG